MLRIRGLAKQFGGRAVLRGVDLDVAPAECVALVGSNGSGKTTTLRAIVGLTRVDSGSVVIAGIDAAGRPREARRHMSYMAQKAGFPEMLTVRETLAAVARLRSLPAGRVAEEIESCGLAGQADRLVDELSGGQRQRVALAVALLPDVALYLFDEPSANLDEWSSRLLAARIHRLRAAGRAVLFTSHVKDDVDRLASRSVRLEEGRAVAAEWSVSHADAVDSSDLSDSDGRRRRADGRLWRPLAGAGAGAAGSR